MAIVANAEVIKRLVILIADGRPHPRALLRSMLSQLEVKNIHEAIDGAAALDAIATVNPDVMFVDWELPVFNAAQVLRTVRSSPTIPYPDLPVVVLSSSGQSRDVHKAMKHGAPHFMVWPISTKMVQQRLSGIVEKARKTALAYKHTSDAAAPGSATEDMQSTR
jgi:two-component system, chemotaxis family, chemotaxis protein CheY